MSTLAEEEEHSTIPQSSSATDLTSCLTVPVSEKRQQIRFIDGISKGTKVLVFEDNIFYAHRKTEDSTQYRCSQSKTTGCQARVVVYNINPEDYTFDRFTVIKGEHENHLPCTKKIQWMEGRTNEMAEGNAETLEECRHICLFCFADLPMGYRDVTCLENVVPNGDALIISLNDPVKNCQAFELLCNRLRVKWRNYNEVQNFDRGSSLPLCFKCQSLYQDMFQLHLQICQLDELIGKHAAIIRDTISKTERRTNTEFEVGGTQLTLLGLDVFRKMVINPRYRHRRCERDPVPQKKQDLSTSTNVEQSNEAIEDVPSPRVLNYDIVKKEVLEDPGEDDASHEPLWTGSNEEVKPNLIYVPVLGMENSMDDRSDFVDDDDYLPHNSDSEFEEQVTRRPRTRSKGLATKSVEGEDDKLMCSEDEGKDDDDDYDANEDVDSDSDFEVRKSHKKIVRRSSGVKSMIFNRSSKYRKRIGFVPKESTCHICSSVFIGQSALLSHYKNEHPEEKRYTCKFCKRHYRDLRDCSIHQRKHTGERPFACVTCTSTFTSKKCLKSHIFRHHTDRSEVIFPCPECEKEFSSKAILSNHLAAVHDHAGQPFYRKSGKPTKSWACHLCDKVVFGHGPFTQHYVDVHPEENRYTCKFCKRHFRDLRDCTRHQRKHTGEKPFQCDFCSKAFRDQKLLRLHQRIHSDLALEHACPKCGKQFPSKSALTGHMNVHNEFLLFCKSCGKSFRNQSSFCKHNKRAHDGQAEHSEPITDPSSETLASLGVYEIQTRMKCHVCWQPILGRIFLKKHFEEHHPDHEGGITTCKCGKRYNSYKDCCKHAIRHSENKAFQCDQCPLTFYTSTELRLHSARHAPLEERQNNVCNICGLGLVSQTALMRHKRKHEDNQIRWVCEQCGKSYAEKKGLDHHTKTEHLKILPHKCSFCERAFALNADLAKHMRTHTGQKPFKCPYCDKCFPYTSSRARHVREVHNVDGEKRKEPTPRKRKAIKSSAEGGGGEQREVGGLGEMQRESSFGSQEQQYFLGQPQQQFEQNATRMPASYSMNHHQDNQYSLGIPIPILKIDPNLGSILESGRPDDPSSMGQVEVKSNIID